MALVELSESVLRAGIAFVNMAVRAYIAGNAGLIAMTRTAASALLAIGPLGLLRAAWTLLGTTTLSMGGVMTGAFALVSGGIRAVGAALMANPLGIILAIASAAWLIVENWDTVKSWFATFWNWLKAHADLILTCLGPIGWIAKTIIGHWEPLKAWFGNLTQWLSEKFRWIIDTAQSVGHALGLSGGDMTMNHTLNGSAAGASTAGMTPLPVGAERTSLIPSAQSAGKVEGQVNIKIDGLPTGSRIEQVRGGTMPINVDAGYSAYALAMP